MGPNESSGDLLRHYASLGFSCFRRVTHGQPSDSSEPMAISVYNRSLLFVKGV